MTDSERLDWIENEIRKKGVFKAERYGMHWVKGFSCSSQHVKQYPDLRQMIDAMIDQSGIDRG